MTLFIPDPSLNRQTPFMRILTALLILGALLFVILMVNNRNNKPPPFTTEITTCTNIVNGEVIDFGEGIGQSELKNLFCFASLPLCAFALSVFGIGGNLRYLYPLPSSLI